MLLVLPAFVTSTASSYTDRRDIKTNPGTWCELFTGTRHSLLSYVIGRACWYSAVTFSPKYPGKSVKVVSDILKGLRTSTTSIILGCKDQRQWDCFPLPVGVVSEFIACCALCGRNFFFISQRTACLIIKALSIAWYNSDNVSLQLNAQYNYVFKKQSYSSC